MIRATALLVVLFFSFSCAATRQAKPPEGDGFLDDYSKLEKGEPGVASLEFVNPGTNWKAYDKLIIDPITFWRGSDVEANLSPAESQTLANYFHARLREELGQDYELVDTPAEGTLRLTATFTRLGGRNVALDTVSTVVPQALVIGTATSLFRDKPSFVGEAALEARVSDSWTGKILGGGVDRRVGGKTIKAMDSWSDVRSAIDHWARAGRYRLCTLREGSDAGCTRP